MQDEINEKTIALYIKTGKLTAQTLQKAMKTLLAQMKKQKDKTPQGKQTLKQLMKQNAGVSNIEITEGNIKAFESTAKKYGIDFALKKDTTESPPRYLVFFKGRDADVLTAAFKEFSAKKLTQEKKPSIRKLLSSLKENDFLLYNEVVYRIHACRTMEEFPTILLTQVKLLIPYAYGSFHPHPHRTRRPRRSPTETPCCYPPSFVHGGGEVGSRPIHRGTAWWLSYAPDGGGGPGQRAPLRGQPV